MSKMESVHGCHAGPSAWQAGGGAALALAPRSSPLNVLKVFLYRIDTEIGELTLQVNPSCRLCDQRPMRLIRFKLYILTIAASWSIDQQAM